ncbi:MAG TPA: cupin domain-containing protein [Verrucomicrobiae bacterium]|nr:cupin domain-containing protein [Verrucomicrobiae bacterium]
MTPKRIPKPWGEEILFAHTGRYAGKVLKIRRGESLSLQYHERKDEALYLFSGRVSVTLGAPGDAEGTSPVEVRRLEPGDSLHLPAGTRHRLEAAEDAILFEVSTPELDDVVRLEDRYGRAGTSEP